MLFCLVWPDQSESGQACYPINKFYRSERLKNQSFELFSYEGLLCHKGVNMFRLTYKYSLLFPVSYARISP